MSRYVDVDRLEPQQFENSEVELGVLAYDYEVVQSEPYIDIVRCGECKLNETDDCPMVYYTPLEDGGIETRWWNGPDDFCSWGEREGE